MTKGLLRHYSPAARSLSNLSRPLRDRMELSQYLRWDHLIIASYPVCENNDNEVLIL